MDEIERGRLAYDKLADPAFNEYYRKRDREYLDLMASCEPFTDEVHHAHARWVALQEMMGELNSWHQKGQRLVEMANKEVEDNGRRSTATRGT